MWTTRTTWSASGPGASLPAVSTLKIQERFSLDAPPELVWEHLVAPARTGDCLPGAEITGQDPNKFLADRGLGDGAEATATADEEAEDDEEPEPEASPEADPVPEPAGDEPEESSVSPVSTD